MWQNHLIHSAFLTKEQNMMMLILISMVTGIVIWAAKTGKYAHGFIAIAIVFSLISFLAGLFEFQHEKPWPGVVMIGVSIAALLGCAALLMRVESGNKGKQCRRRIRPSI